MSAVRARSPHDLIHKASPLLAAVLLSCALSSAYAQIQSDTPRTHRQKIVDRFDLSVVAAGQFNSTVSGPILPSNASNYCLYNTNPVTNVRTASNCGSNNLTQYASNTLGAIVTVRYIAKPYLGFEYNYGYARYNENYTGPAVSNFSPTTSDFQIQTKATEYSFGYVITPPHKIYGLQPFASIGAGTIAFRPTPRGGQEAPEKARANYYYSIGVQQDYLNGHLGLRAGFRQTIFLAPDFGQSYLTILKRASTYEPIAGFYLRF